MSQFQLSPVLPVGTLTMFQLGQALEPVEAQPLLQLPPEAYSKMADVWQSLREQCQKVLTPAQCNQLLGYRPFPSIGEESPAGLKWWHFTIIGFILGRLFR